MQITRLAIPAVVLLQPAVHADARGSFFESYRQPDFDAAIGHPVAFVQDNQSFSHRGVLRGLHFQRAPHAQGKLVRVVRGSIFDVAVDLRPGSDSFGRWVGATLSAESRQQLWVPEGFAHGFLALEDATEVLYKTTGVYDRASEGGIRWDDPEIGIDWPLTGAPLLSGKDAELPALAAIRGSLT